LETRNPLVRGWEALTPERAVEIVRDGAVVRMAAEAEPGPIGDLASLTAA
jgi:hypothetical protein